MGRPAQLIVGVWTVILAGAATLLLTAGWYSSAAIRARRESIDH